MGWGLSATHTSSAAETKGRGGGVKGKKENSRAGRREAGPRRTWSNINTGISVSRGKTRF